MTTLNDVGLDPALIADVVDRALAEDLGAGDPSVSAVDVTSTATIPADLQGIADVRTRAAGVVAGLEVAALVFARAGANVTIVASDGDRVQPGDVVLTAEGPVRRLLTVERTMLNLLCHLSGVATLTARWVEAVEATGARIRDTRKTTPGLRVLEKYAVRCGGGVNHRMGLWDAALVKDNHVAAAGGVAAAFRAVREAFPGVTVEVECDTVAQVREAIASGADLLLLDNMSLADLRTCVELAPSSTLLEASGGLTLDSAHDVAATGVTYLSVGALTHSAPILDLGMDLRSDPSDT
ncbi:MAG TPA: carboxylating nicotinate-nucleotide diphosphorylase [Frankiaceae bacterium]|jgi:nicotinate-nucleotide pyrophosphorylase (carboxylating)|nr:carboxylating nicotinate-nucleotide diphosphorylase [Frankiaceae bacterium]